MWRHFCDQRVGIRNRSQVMLRPSTRARKSSRRPDRGSLQASSAVKERIGAISFSNSSRIYASTVWAERRARESARRGVKAILQYVEIKTAQLLRAIELQLPHDLMELVLR